MPVVLALFAWDGVARHRAAEATLADLVRRELAGDRARCEADPAGWAAAIGGAGPRQGRQGPPPDGERVGRPPDFTVFDEGIASASGVDDVPDGLAASIAPGDYAPLDSRWFHEDVGVLVRAPWGGGRCAYVLARGTTVAGWLGAVLPATHVWLAPVVAALAVVLLAAGPIVARIRRLTRAVQRSAAHDFEDDVPTSGDDEIAELGRAFRAASEAVRARAADAEAREKALRDFLANTTHDVMIPLTVLQGHLATLQREVPAESVAAAMDEAHYIAALLRNLAATATLDATDHLAPAGPSAPTDLGAIVTRVMSRHRVVAAARGIAIESAVPEGPVWVAADATLLEQAVSNVVHNAVRHNRPGGHVAVVLEAGRDAFTLRVEDDGEGVSPDALARLSERGFRTDEARTRSPEGAGLGLNITRRVAERSGFGLRFGHSVHGGMEVVMDGPLAPE